MCTPILTYVGIHTYVQYIYCALIGIFTTNMYIYRHILCTSEIHMHTQAHTCSCTDMCIQACIYMHMYAYTWRNTYMHKLPHPHTCINTSVPMCAHTCKHMYTHSCTHLHTHVYHIVLTPMLTTNIGTFSDIQEHWHKHTYTHIPEHVCTHTWILTHVHTHMHEPWDSGAHCELNAPITSGSIECQQWESTETSHSLIYRGIALAAMWALPGTRLHGLGALLRAGVNVKARVGCTHLLCDDVVRVGERANSWIFQRNNFQSFFNFTCL